VPSLAGDGWYFAWPLGLQVACQPVGGSAVDIRSAQKLAWENKLAKGFNTTDIPLEFCLLSGEVAEAFDAWRKGRPQVAEELADVAIYLLGLAEMAGSDLQEAVEAKLAVNEARVYRRLPNGVPVKDAAATETPPPSAPRLCSRRACGGVDRDNWRVSGELAECIGVGGYQRTDACQGRGVAVAGQQAGSDLVRLPGEMDQDAAALRHHHG
jgi:hypothetical protein